MATKKDRKDTPTQLGQELGENSEESKSEDMASAREETNDGIDKADLSGTLITML